MGGAYSEIGRRYLAETVSGRISPSASAMVH